MKGKRDMKGKGSVDSKHKKRILMMEQLSPRDQEIEEKTVTAVNILMSIKKKETKEPKTSTSCTQL